MMLKVYLVTFDAPQQMQFQLGFRFPNCITACLDDVSVFPPGCLAVLYSFFVRLSFVRNSSFIHAGLPAFLSNSLLFLPPPCPCASTIPSSTSPSTCRLRLTTTCLNHKKKKQCSVAAHYTSNRTEKPVWQAKAIWNYNWNWWTTQSLLNHLISKGLGE